MASMRTPNDFKALSCEDLQIADTRVTVDNIPLENGVTNQVKSRSKEQVAVGNGENMESKAIGELKGTATDVNGNPKTSVAPKDVACTPQSHFNLISLKN